MKINPDTVPHGVRLLHDPLRNKGTAFTDAERDALWPPSRGRKTSWRWCRRMCMTRTIQLRLAARRLEVFRPAYIVASCVVP